MRSAAGHASGFVGFSLGIDFLAHWAAQHNTIVPAIILKSPKNSHKQRKSGSHTMAKTAKIKKRRAYDFPFFQSQTEAVTVPRTLAVSEIYIRIFSYILTTLKKSQSTPAPPAAQPAPPSTSTSLSSPLPAMNLRLKRKSRAY
jgi:hypothetical protein